MEKNDIIGGAHSKVKHDSAVRHVTGKAIYIDDIPDLPGTLEALFVTSPYAHARIVSIDSSSAQGIEGVHAVLTAGDIPGKNDIAPVFENEQVLASETVEYVGHPVALVAAETYDIAYAAIKKVVVNYDKLEPVLSIQEALKREQFTFPKQVMERGDYAAAIKSAHRKISGQVSCGGQDHFYLEGQIALAQPGEEKDMLVAAGG